jgi:hypothetical protein
LDDSAQWALANPALGRRISVEAIETERASLPDDSFARERLGIWSVDRQEYLIPPAVWSGLVDTRQVDGSFPTAVAVDRSNDGLMVIAGAWRDDDGRVYVRLLDLQENADDPQTAENFLTAWSTRTPPIVVDERSTAAVLIDRLERVRPRRTVVRVNALVAAQSAQAFLDEVLAGRLLHAGQEALDGAVGSARRRPIGDAGGWGFDRRDEMVAIAPLVAASLARYGAVAHGRRPRKPQRVIGLG